MNWVNTRGHFEDISMLATYQYRNYMLITGFLMNFLLIIPKIPVWMRKKLDRCPVTKGIKSYYMSEILGTKDYFDGRTKFFPIAWPPHFEIPWNEM